jgi:hypothetical protein
MPTPVEIASALADEDRLRAFARIILAEELPSAEAPSARHVRRLTQAGLVASETDGRLVARPAAFREALASMRKQLADNPISAEDPALAALFTGGRLTVMPTKPALRQKLMQRMADHFFAVGTTYTENEVNAKLAAVHADYSMLRRYLIDFNLLTRSPDGSAYHRSATADNAVR